jgi:VanZ family protein
MKTCKLSRRKKVTVAIIYMFFLLGSSLIPIDLKFQGPEFLIDLKSTIQNLLHVPMYFIMSFFLLLIFRKLLSEPWKRNLLVLLVVCFLGLITEIIQIPVPGRYGRLTDILLNFAGALAGIIVFGLVEKSKSRLMRRIICE